MPQLIDAKAKFYIPLSDPKGYAWQETEHSHCRNVWQRTRWYLDGWRKWILKLDLLISKSNRINTKKTIKQNFFIVFWTFKQMRRRRLRKRGHGQTSMISSNLLLKCMIQAGPLPEQGLLPRLLSMVLPTFWCPTHQKRWAASVERVVFPSPEWIPLLLAQARGAHSQHNLTLVLETRHYPPMTPSHQSWAKYFSEWNMGSGNIRISKRA